MADVEYNLLVVANGEEVGQYAMTLSEHANPSITIYHPGGSSWITVPPNNMPRIVKLEINGSLEAGRVPEGTEWPEEKENPLSKEQETTPIVEADQGDQPEGLNVTGPESTANISEPTSTSEVPGENVPEENDPLNVDV